jgi:Asp-tRNA(Asn)/Glu-tRNA(Gln) amidotransferase A subunit family amidase
LGVPDGPYLDQASAEGLTAFERQIEQLKAAGYTVVRVSALEDIREIAYRHVQLMSYELAENHATWFAEFEDRYRPATAQLIREGQDIDRLAAQAAVSGQEMVRRDLETRMADFNIDLWISPAATGPAPEGIESTGDSAMNLPWTHAGLPTITIPAGTAENGLPLGLQYASVFGNDEQLLQWAVGLENVFTD